MGRSAGPRVLLTLACAFSSCCAEVTQGVKTSSLTTSFKQTDTSAQPPSLYRSSTHGDTTFHVSSTSSLKTTPISRRTTVQAASESPVTAQPPQTTAQAAATTMCVREQAAPAGFATTGAGDTAAASPSSNGAGGTEAPAATNRTVHLLCTTTRAVTNESSATAGVAANTTGAPMQTKNQTAIVITTTTTKKTTVKTTQGTTNQTTAPQTATTTAVATTTTVRPRNQTTIPSTTTTVRPTPAPQPSAIPTGTYAVRNGSTTCIRAVMGLQLMAQNIQKKRLEYVNINPNKTQTSGSCGTRQSALNITFSGGFINFVFVKKARTYYVSVIEASLQSEGMLYYATIQEQMFTTKLGNSFKCASKQVFTLEKNFQLLTVNMQLQAFGIVGNQFGKEEECYLDRNSKAVPIAVGLSILGLFVIVLVTFVISRRKPNRGYERI
ncbi:PREDICTED: lysosome-associated membrane glycoprotein 3 [Tinamus guttatus]|nr:PREDICTED: lysosome-associated membrane glycoprotein 3 [Tinamus guttatus]